MVSEEAVGLASDSGDGDDTRLKSQLRGGDEPISASLLREVLSRALEAVNAEHRALTAAWRAPISLFDEHAREKAVSRGVPSWAVAIVGRVQVLVDEAAALDDLATNYQGQITAGKRAGRGIAREPLLKLLEGLESLAVQLRTALEQLRAARAAFDAPADAPSECPFTAHARNEASATAALEGELRNVEVPILAPEPTHQRLWQSVVAAGRKVKYRATPSVEVQAAVGARLGAAGRSSRNLVRGAFDTASRLGEGLLSLQEGTHPLLRRVLQETSPPRRKWDEVSGHPSDWINVEDSVRLHRRIELRLNLYESLPEHWLQNPAQSHWERCRRGSERRWTL